MRKLLLFVLLLLVPGAIVTAAPPEELSDLARLYTDDTIIFASVRTDDGFIDLLDGLLTQVTPFLPEGAAPPDGILRATLVDQLAANDFEYDAVREWLGDTAAIGLTIDALSQNSTTPPFYAAFAADGDAAAAFFEPMFASEVEDGNGVMETIGDYTVYRAANEADLEFSPAFAIGDDVVLIGTYQAMPFAGVDTPLSENAEYQDVVAGLPADDYNAFITLNVASINQFTLELAAQQGLAGTPGSFLNSLSQSVGYQAFAFTILDDTNLTIDVVQQVNIAAFAELGIDEMYIPSPLDLDFANRIPADASLVIMSADFGQSNLAALNQLRSLSTALKANGGIIQLIDPTGMIFDAQTRAAGRAIDPFGIILGTTNVTFAGLTGLSLERDVLPVLDGDSALYLRALPADDFVSPVVPDLGLVIGTSDTAAAQGIVEALIAASEAYDANYPVEAYGDGSALVMPLLQRAAQVDFPDLDILIGADDGVFAAGTRPAVMNALDTSGGLAADAAFVEAQNYFLPGSQQIFYANVTPALDLVDQLAEAQMLPIDRETVEIRRLASLVESASISATATDSGSSTIRLVLSLADEPTTFSDAVLDMIETTEDAIVPTLAFATPTFVPTATPGN